MVGGKIGGKLFAFTLLYELVATTTLVGQTNAWIKATDGNWAETNSWSLGSSPTIQEAIYITNANTKTVTIDSTTAQNAPSSLSIDWLRIDGPNTLVLNNVSNAMFQVGILTYVWTSGKLVQVGGSSRYNTIYTLHDAVFALTNATTDIAWFESVDPGDFIQDGGNSKFGNMKLYPGMHGLLKNGLMQIDDTLDCRGLFTQIGGTNYTKSMLVPFQYNLDNNGLLIDDTVFVGPDGSFNNISGNHVITNTLTIQGAARYYPPVPIPADYQCGGSLNARELVIDQRYGFSHFSNSGDVHIAEEIKFIGDRTYRGTFSTSGVITCSNLVSEGTVVDMAQTAGTLIVTNQFSFSGLFPGFYGSGERPAHFLFSGGTLSASNINLTAEWTIQSSNTLSRITNTGTFTMAGLLHLIDGTEHLGRLILSSNAVVDLGGASAKLSFANSSAESWNPPALLIVSNWNGSVSGGGADQLVFGNNVTGLTSNQLGQIRFVDPAGLASGTYFAQILSTGEVVPAPRPLIQFQPNASSIVLNWPADWILQQTTNLSTPFADVSANSPYTNFFGSAQQSYFRLRAP